MVKSTNMPFYVHIALGLQLLALISGCLLLSKSAKGEFFYKRTGKWVGAFVILVSLLSILCMTVLSIQNYCREKEAKLEERMWQHPPIDWSKHGKEMEKQK